MFHIECLYLKNNYSLSNLSMFNRALLFITIVVTGILWISTDSYAIAYYNWPKGGCYYLSSLWKKVYVSHQLCDRNDEGTSWIYNSKTKKTYYTWPEGGCFYYSGNYKKNYVKHSYCGR